MKRLAIFMLVGLLGSAAFPGIALADGGTTLGKALVRWGGRANTVIGAFLAYNDVVKYAEKKGCTTIRDGRKYWNVGCTVEAAAEDVKQKSR